VRHQPTVGVRHRQERQRADSEQLQPESRERGRLPGVAANGQRKPAGAVLATLRMLCPCRTEGETQALAAPFARRYFAGYAVRLTRRRPGRA